jgi:hypothetical protein
MKLLLRLFIAAGLTVDAIVHWIFAPEMAGVEGGSLGGDTLFYAQAVIAGVAGVLVLAWPRRWTYVIAFLVAATAVGAVLFYRYADVGAIGPLPEMYEPVWYAEKTISAIAEGIAMVLAAVGIFVGGPRTPAHRETPQPRQSEAPWVRQ